MSKPRRPTQARSTACQSGHDRGAELEKTGLARVQLSWASGTTPQPAPAGTVIVDDIDPGFVTGGAAAGWRTVAEGYNGRLTWTYNNRTIQNYYNWARFAEPASGVVVGSSSTSRTVTPRPPGALLGRAHRWLHAQDRQPVGQWGGLGLPGNVQVRRKQQRLRLACRRHLRNLPKPVDRVRCSEVGAALTDGRISIDRPERCDARAGLISGQGSMNLREQASPWVYSCWSAMALSVSV